MKTYHKDFYANESYVIWRSGFENEIPSRNVIHGMIYIK